jgi:hypothetical protein
MGNYQSQYTKTYTSFSGADIVATFNNIVIGELQAITYSVTREKAPIYTMGSANPRSFSRGKRGIAGSLVFSVFDGDCLAQLKKDSTVTLPYMNKTSKQGGSASSISEWDSAMGQKVSNNEITDGFYESMQSYYADEIPPFDIIINFQNEYGQKAVMRLYGVELLNEGMGLSVDDITTEKALTFVARELGHMEKR